MFWKQSTSELDESSVARAGRRRGFVAADMLAARIKARYRVDGGQLRARSTAKR